jgi:hypothetical protein
MLRPSPGKPEAPLRSPSRWLLRALPAKAPAGIKARRWCVQPTVQRGAMELRDAGASGCACRELNAAARTSAVSLCSMRGSRSTAGSGCASGASRSPPYSRSDTHRATEAMIQAAMQPRRARWWDSTGRQHRSGESSRRGFALARGPIALFKSIREGVGLAPRILSLSSSCAAPVTRACPASRHMPGAASASGTRSR